MRPKTLIPRRPSYMTTDAHTSRNGVPDFRSGRQAAQRAGQGGRRDHLAEAGTTDNHATDVGHGCPAPTPSVLSHEGARMRPKKDIPLLEVFGGGAGRSAGVHSQLHLRQFGVRVRRFEARVRQLRVVLSISSTCLRLKLRRFSIFG